MKKRIILSLDEDLVEALQARGARSLSAAANDALREAIAEDAYRAALLAWLDELDAVVVHHPQNRWPLRTRCSMQSSAGSRSQRVAAVKSARRESLRRARRRSVRHPRHPPATPICAPCCGAQPSTEAGSAARR